MIIQKHTSRNPQPIMMPILRNTEAVPYKGIKEITQDPIPIKAKDRSIPTIPPSYPYRESKGSYRNLSNLGLYFPKKPP